MTHTPGTLSEQWLTTKNQRLREINRELLAALEALVAEAGGCCTRLATKDQARAAIRKATGG